MEALVAVLASTPLVVGYKLFKNRDVIAYKLQRWNVLRKIKKYTMLDDIPALNSAMDKLDGLLQKYKVDKKPNNKLKYSKRELEAKKKELLLKYKIDEDKLNGLLGNLQKLNSDGKLDDISYKLLVELIGEIDNIYKIIEHKQTSIKNEVVKAKNMLEKLDLDKILDTENTKKIRAGLIKKKIESHIEKLSNNKPVSQNNIKLELNRKKSVVRL